MHRQHHQGQDHRRVSSSLAPPLTHNLTRVLQLSRYPPSEILQDPPLWRGMSAFAMVLPNIRVHVFAQTIRPQEACEAVGVNTLDIATTARRALSTFVRVPLRPSRSSGPILMRVWIVAREPQHRHRADHLLIVSLTILIQIVSLWGPLPHIHVNHKRLTYCDRTRRCFPSLQTVLSAGIEIEMREFVKTRSCYMHDPRLCGAEAFYHHKIHQNEQTSTTALYEYTPHAPCIVSSPMNLKM